MRSALPSVTASSAAATAICSDMSVSMKLQVSNKHARPSLWLFASRPATGLTQALTFLPRDAMHPRY